MLYNEAASLIAGLKELQLEDILSELWLQQMRDISRLSLAAHHAVLEQKEDFVSELFIEREQIGTLIHELVLIDLYRRRVHPLLRSAGAFDSLDTVRPYILLFHEQTLAGFLQLVLFHRDALICTDDAAIVELIDWSSRKLRILAAADQHFDWSLSGASLTAPAPGLRRSARTVPARLTPEQKLAEAHRRAKEELARIEQGDDPARAPTARAEELSLQERDTLWSSACSAVAIARYIAEAVADLPIGVQSRLVDTVDAVPLLCAVLRGPAATGLRPWLRRGPNGRELFEDGTWRPLPASQYSRVSKMDAQALLALVALLTEPKVTSSFRYSPERIDAIVSLKGLLHDSACDQLPPLTTLRTLVHQVEIQAPALAQQAQSGPITSMSAQIGLSTASAGERATATANAGAAAFFRGAVVEAIPEIETRLLRIARESPSFSAWRRGRKEDNPSLFVFLAEAVVLARVALGVSRKPADLLLLAAVFATDEAEEFLALSSQAAAVCATCGRPADKRCSKCRSVWYCSCECQKRHWATHKPVCKILRKTAAPMEAKTAEIRACPAPGDILLPAVAPAPAMAVTEITAPSPTPMPEPAVSLSLAHAVEVIDDVDLLSEQD
jgi:hypothetical protein